MSVTEHQRAVLDALGGDAVAVDELRRRTGLPAKRLARAVAGLVRAGRLERDDAGRLRRRGRRGRGSVTSDETDGRAAV